MSEVVTGEAVVLELPVASFPGRLLALMVDLIAQAALVVLASIGISLMIGQLNGDYIAAALVSAYLAITVVYSTLWETMTRGKTPGKMALGLRVVSDDGSPVRFRQALVRSLVGLLEIYTVVLAPVALITSIVSVKGKRLGDIFAGTYVLQERMPARAALPPVFAVVPPPLAGWAQSLQLSQLSDQTAEAAGSYLRRYGELTPRARESLGIQLANAVAAEVSPPPPPGTPPPAYLAAVLAMRRERDQARAGQSAATPPLPPSLRPVSLPTQPPVPLPAQPPVSWQPVPPPPVQPFSTEPVPTHPPPDRDAAPAPQTAPAPKLSDSAQQSNPSAQDFAPPG